MIKTCLHILILAFSAMTLISDATEARVCVSNIISEQSIGKWTALEGKMNDGKAEFSISNDTLCVAGAVATECRLGDPLEAGFKGSVRFHIPALTVEWASAALALYDKDRRNRIYFMALFNQPGMPADEVEACIFGHAQKRLKAAKDRWYSMRAGISDGRAAMKIWADGEKEPEGWQVETDVPGDVADVAAAGLRTYNAVIPFKDFFVESQKAPAAAGAVGDDRIKAEINAQGMITKLEVKRSGMWEAVDFRRDGYKGPAWHVEEAKGVRDIRLSATNQGKTAFAGVSEGVEYTLAYSAEQGRLVISAGLKNAGNTEFKPVRCGLRLGLDTEMAHYPQWNNKYSPTLLRCEKTHFWGYFMTPGEAILAVSSPDPVASYTTHYNNGGHRIHTSSLEFMNAGPLPPRHPQDLASLPAGGQKRWKVILQDVKGLEKVKEDIAFAAGVPMIECDRYTIENGAASVVAVYSGSPVSGAVTAPDGRTVPLLFNAARAGLYTVSFKPTDGVGLYTLRVSDSGNKVSEAMVSVRHPWSWYVRCARSEALKKVQIASSHTEGWYGFYPAYAARRVLPEPALDSAVEEKFAELWPLMYDMDKKVPVKWQNRIQNHSAAAELMVDKFRATGDVKDLEFAAGLADYILTTQTADGAYRNGRVHYTCVIYVAKNILTVALAEAQMAAKDPRWAEKAKRHYASVTRALDELAKNRDNIETEGEMTYEDGMIACSYAQLGLFALQQTEPALVRKYLDAAQYMRKGHQCLSQLLIPDSRMNGASLRYWESQYDVLMGPNMMNSPHGWSAWRVYGLWYLYLLTGEEAYMRQVENALGSCAQLIDFKTGNLRWGFVPDPFVRASVIEEDPATPGKPVRKSKLIGEQYIPMISGWYKPPKATFVTGYWGNDGGCCNNDVHEIFKCISEVMLENAHVLERADGSFQAWNCTVKKGWGGVLIVTPSDTCVTRVHLNLKSAHKVKAEFSGGKVHAGLKPGMCWLGPGGEPFQLRKFAELIGGETD
ncbi:MAG: hypothetical protein WCK89_18345 [bacterium]